MSHRIDNVAIRSKLKARQAPYWHKLSTGCHLGFRKLTPSSDGVWYAQAYDKATGTQTRRSLGAFDELPAHQRFDAAKKAAEDWFKHLDRGGDVNLATVGVACERYVAHVLTDRGPDQAKDIDSRFKRWVYADKIADIDLPKLTRHHVDAWRRKLAAVPVIVNSKSKRPTTRARAPGSVNRDMTALRAALNFSHDHGAVTSDMAWRVALRPIRNADKRRDAYLSREQRSALLKNATTDVGLFLRGLSLVPLRPGALAALRVAHFDKRLGVLTIGKDKSGRDRKIKLPAATAAFFADCTTKKLPTAPMFARADGRAWNKDAWKWPIKEAAAAAKLPEDVTAYAMRHSAITDLVTTGLDLLTVAVLSGTSVAMIEKHYGHLRADHAAAALATLAL
jgi:integrase